MLGGRNFKTAQFSDYGGATAHQPHPGGKGGAGARECRGKGGAGARGCRGKVGAEAGGAGARGCRGKGMQGQGGAGSRGCRGKEGAFSSKTLVCNNVNSVERKGNEEGCERVLCSKTAS